MPRWTEESKRRQAEKIRQWKPWTRSTGPKTPEGRARTRYNGLKHGMRSQAMRDLRAALRAQRAFLRRFKQKMATERILAQLLEIQRMAAPQQAFACPLSPPAWMRYKERYA